MTFLHSLFWSVVWVCHFIYNLSMSLPLQSAWCITSFPLILHFIAACSLHVLIFQCCSLSPKDPSCPTFKLCPQDTQQSLLGSFNGDRLLKECQNYSLLIWKVNGNKKRKTKDCSKIIELPVDKEKWVMSHFIVCSTLMIWAKDLFHWDVCNSKILLFHIFHRH